MLTGIGTIGSGIAIVGAAFLGRQAAANFRKQKQAEREIEQAERALAAAYMLESAISTIRSPMTTGAESAQARSELKETDWFAALDDRKKSRIVQANVFYQRIRRFQEDFNGAIIVLPFVKAYFGEAADQAFRDLIHCRHSVRVYVDAYAEDEGQDADFSRKIKSFIWEGFSLKDGYDPIKQKVKSSLDDLEQVLLPIIRSRDAVILSTKVA